jgi:hypothetical protein
VIVFITLIQFDIIKYLGKLRFAGRKIVMRFEVRRKEMVRQGDEIEFIWSECGRGWSQFNQRHYLFRL